MGTSPAGGDAVAAAAAAGVLHVTAQSLTGVQLFTMPWTVACQAPLSMGFPRQEYWGELPCPSPEHVVTLNILFFRD